MAVHKRRSEDIKQLKVRPGLYLLRYLSAVDQDNPPEIELKPRKRDDVDIIDSRGELERRMSEPGDFLIIRAGEASVIEMISEPTVPNGSVAANLSFQQLNNSVFSTHEVTNNVEPASPSARSWAGRSIADQTENNLSLEVMGHMARHGDVFVSGGEWLGGPESPAVIEGMQIDWPRQPRGVALRYAVMPANAGERPMHAAGSFAGTRGKARPVKFIHLELTGPQASEYELVVAAIFLGSPIKHSQGRQITLRGAAGTEPLVGLRVAVSRSVSEGVRPEAGTWSRDRLPLDLVEQERSVKVFRRSGPSGKAGGR